MEKQDTNRTYIHGFDTTEQKRLIHQAAYLENYVYPGIDLKGKKHLLEVGCGVGAQTKIILKRFPRLKVTGIDFSERQLQTAASYLSTLIKKGQVDLFQRDAAHMDGIQNRHYDAAFLCWFLEHVPDPLSVLRETRRKLRPGAPIYCTEVFNSTLFLEPYSPASLKYWFEFNDYQWSVNGHPFVGAELGNLLRNAGYRNIQTEIRSFHFDSRHARTRASFIRYFGNILLSAAPGLLEKKRVDTHLIEEMKREFEVVAKAKDSVFFYSFVRAVAST